VFPPKCFNLISIPALSHAISTITTTSPLSSLSFVSIPSRGGLADRRHIFDDDRSLKILAMAYLHPKKVIFNHHFLLEGTDPADFGRNYFDRYSAPETEEFEVAEERARVLAEAGALKKVAVDYSHPEVSVTSADGACFGRNYFNRYSAPETEDDEFADERAEITEEMAALKKLAVDYFHPEMGVRAADATLFGRNYFDRYSAPET
jgi:xylose isomerase